MLAGIPDWEIRSNCTLLELKQKIARSNIASDGSSNCTLLELKLEKSGYFGVPFAFELHLTGIETFYGPHWYALWGVRIAPYWNWNSDKILILMPSYHVRIAPYWNWNSHKLKNNIRYILFELHLTGIETYPEACFCSSPYCSNCTLLELKLRYYCWASAFLASSNCTLLELKRIAWDIEPTARLSSNCTLLELKLAVWAAPAAAVAGSNCTLLELKHIEAFLICLPLPSSNCTLLELKRPYYLFICFACFVRIAPYWNWN